MARSKSRHSSSSVAKQQISKGAAVKAKQQDKKDTTVKKTVAAKAKKKRPVTPAQKTTRIRKAYASGFTNGVLRWAPGASLLDGRTGSFFNQLKAGEDWEALGLDHWAQKPVKATFAIKSLPESFQVPTALKAIIDDATKSVTEAVEKGTLSSSLSGVDLLPEDVQWFLFGPDTPANKQSRSRKQLQLSVRTYIRRQKQDEAFETQTLACFADDDQQARYAVFRHKDEIARATAICSPPIVVLNVTKFSREHIPAIVEVLCLARWFEGLDLKFGDDASKPKVSAKDLERVSLLKVSDLRAELDRLGLDRTGTKAMLVKRIHEALAHTDKNATVTANSAESVQIGEEKVARDKFLSVCNALSEPIGHDHWDVCPISAHAQLAKQHEIPESAMPVVAQVARELWCLKSGQAAQEQHLNPHREASLGKLVYLPTIHSGADRSKADFLTSLAEIGVTGVKDAFVDCGSAGGIFLVFEETPDIADLRKIKFAEHPMFINLAKIVTREGQSEVRFCSSPQIRFKPAPRGFGLEGYAVWLKLHRFDKTLSIDDYLQDENTAFDIEALQDDLAIIEKNRQKESEAVKIAITEKQSALDKNQKQHSNNDETKVVDLVVTSDESIIVKKDATKKTAAATGLTAQEPIDLAALSLLETRIGELLSAHPEGLIASETVLQFRALFDEALAVKKLGFKNLKKCFSSMSKTVVIEMQERGSRKVAVFFAAKHRPINLTTETTTTNDKPTAAAAAGAKAAQEKPAVLILDKEHKTRLIGLFTKFAKANPHGMLVDGGFSHRFTASAGAPLDSKAAGFANIRDCIHHPVFKRIIHVEDLNETNFGPQLLEQHRAKGRNHSLLVVPATKFRKQHKLGPLRRQLMSSVISERAAKEAARQRKAQPLSKRTASQMQPNQPHQQHRPDKRARLNDHRPSTRDTRGRDFRPQQQQPQQQRNNYPVDPYQQAPKQQQQQQQQQQSRYHQNQQPRQQQQQQKQPSRLREVRSSYSNDYRASAYTAPIVTRSKPTPPPTAWEKLYNEDGDAFFHHTKNHAVQWHRPANVPIHEPKERSWRAYHDKNDIPYYHNYVTKDTQWSKPAKMVPENLLPMPPAGQPSFSPEPAHNNNNNNNNNNNSSSSSSSAYARTDNYAAKSRSSPYQQKTAYPQQRGHQGQQRSSRQGNSRRQPSNNGRGNQSNGRRGGRMSTNASHQFHASQTQYF